MPFLYRSAVIVSRRQPYVDWANSCSDDEKVTFPPELAKSRDVYLGPYSPIQQTLDQVLDAMWEGVFEEELFGWSTLEREWPQNRSREMFDAWFDTELADSIIDLVPEDPLTEQDVELLDIEATARECAWCKTELFEDGGRDVSFELSDRELIDDRLNRLLALSLGRDRTVTGIVMPLDPERPEEGAQLVVRACCRACEKHLLEGVPRGLRELEEFREGLRRQSDG